MSAILEISGLSKRFGAVQAVDNVDLVVEAGEIHAVLGENGAGKTTLMNLLSGVYRPDAGEIRYQGQPVTFRSPRAAAEAGIYMVHQHFTLVPTLTVAENVALGTRYGGRWSFDRAAARDLVMRIAERVGFQIDPTVRVEDLTVGQQQRVEILKALARDTRLLILDEPTAVLTPQETEGLFRVLRELNRRGLTILFVSHKLAEVRAICHRVTVLRQGRRVATLPLNKTEEKDLARLLVGDGIPAGEGVGTEGYDAPSSAGGRQPVMELDAVWAPGPMGVGGLRGLTLTLHRGEIVGVAGVDGNGQQELAQVATGMRRITRGALRLDGRDVTTAGAAQLFRLGVRHIPADRKRDGLAAGLTLAENLVLRGSPFDHKAWLDPSEMSRFAQTRMSAFEVRAPGPWVPAGWLSGGNQQKLILARELGEGVPRVLVAAYPSRGLDLAATAYVHRKLRECRKQGTAVLLISADLDELQALSDRIVVLYGGRIVGETAPGVRREQLGLLMMGLTGKGGAPDAEAV